MRPPARRFTPPRTGWHRELPGRVRRYFDERRLLKWVLVTGVVCFVAGYVLMTVLFFPGFGRSAIVTVPDLTNRTAQQAGRALDRLGLEVERGDSLPNPRVRRGRVLMQSPLPGEEVARGSTVRIVLSAGPEVRQVPEITGLSRAAAIGLLQRFGFRVAIRRVHDRRDEGTLLGLSPQAGQRAAVGDVVTLMISAGPPWVPVPGVVGLPSGDARSQLQAVGLEMGRVSYDPFSAGPQGVVVTQAPAPGDSLRMGAGVRVTLAGPDPNPPPPPVEPDTLDGFDEPEPVAEPDPQGEPPLP